MSRSLLCMALLLPLVLSGCMVRSLNPIYTDEDLVQMPALEGTWKADDEGETFSFVRDGDQYRFTFTEDGIPLTAMAHFAKIGKRTYMDLTVDESSFQQLDENALDAKTKGIIQSQAAFSYPIHLFYQVEVAGNLFRTREMDSSWAKERREKGHLWISHTADGDSTLLTADTARVQRFLRRWENSEAAWGEWDERPLSRADASTTK